MNRQNRIIKVLDGVNSDILYHDHPDGSRKVSARYGVKKGGFTLEQAKEMLFDINNYRNKLQQINIPLPEEDHVLLEHDPQTGKATVTRVTSWVGEDMASVISGQRLNKNISKIKKMIHSMCAIMAPVICNRLEGWAVEVGFDPRCSNFTVDHKGKIWFVDLFPPRYRKNGQPIVEWPVPKTTLGRRLGYFKHYDVRGIILCFISQLSRIRPDLRYFFEESTLKYFRNVLSKQEYWEFLSGYSNLPWIKFREILKDKKNRNSFLELKELIERGVQLKIFNGIDYNIYNLREMASELAVAGFMSEEELENFFKASHFEDKLSKDKVTDLQNKLISFLNLLLK